MTTTRLLVIRHGETDWARDRRHTGRTDMALNETGRAQAAALAGHLPLAGVSATWTSPLSRGHRDGTARRIKVDDTDDDLMEWDYGDADGRTTDELRSIHPRWDVWDGGVQLLGATARRWNRSATGSTG